MEEKGKNFNSEINDYKLLEELGKNFKLTPLNEKLDYCIKENEYLKKYISKNKSDLIKEKIESDELIKKLTKENQRLANVINDIIDQHKESEDLFKLLKGLAIRQESQLNYCIKELNCYRNKDKKVNKKKIIKNEILGLKEKGFTYRKIADIYKVSPSTIHYWINKAPK